jgi:hypothetical protein
MVLGLALCGLPEVRTNTAFAKRQSSITPGDEWPTSLQAINGHPPRDQFSLAKAETPARRRLASRLTSCPRTLLVKSSWAFAPSTLLLLQDKRFGSPSVAR